MTEYTQGVTHDGAVILKDGVSMNIEEILEELRQKETMKAPPSKRMEAITDLIFEWIGPDGCDQREVAERLQYLLENAPPGLAKLGRLLHACEEIRDDLLMRADIDPDGTRAVNVSHSKWERFNEAMDVASSALLGEGLGPEPAGYTNAERQILAEMHGLNERILAPDHTGMKVSAPGILSRVSGRLRFGAQAMLRHLQEMSDRFYSGDLKAVDEFLQLYCLDTNRPKCLDGGEPHEL